MNYNLCLERDALRFTWVISGLRRRQLGYWLDRLENAPFTTGTATVKDPVGREIQVSTFSCFRIFHWTDHPAKMVHVVKIEFND